MKRLILKVLVLREYRPCFWQATLRILIDTRPPRLDESQGLDQAAWSGYPRYTGGLHFEVYAEALSTTSSWAIIGSTTGRDKMTRASGSRGKLDRNSYGAGADVDSNSASSWLTGTCHSSQGLCRRHHGICGVTYLTALGVDDRRSRCLWNKRAVDLFFPLAKSRLMSDYQWTSC